nr:phosphoglucomutase [Desulfurococcales archaeon]
KESKGIVIVSVDVGMEVEEVVEKMGGKIVRSKLGKQHEKLKELGGKAVLAAEPWKLIDPSWGPWVDGIYQAALLSRISLETGLRPVDLIRSLPFYPSARLSIKFSSDREKKEVFQKSREEIGSKLAGENADILNIDGIRVQLEEGSWLLLRASGTEPKVRIYAQSRDPKKLADLVEKAKMIVLSTARGLDVKVLGLEEYVDDRPPRPGSLESIF